MPSDTRGSPPTDAPAPTRLKPCDCGDFLTLDGACPCPASPTPEATPAPPEPPALGLVRELNAAAFAEGRIVVTEEANGNGWTEHCATAEQRRMAAFDALTARVASLEARLRTEQDISLRLNQSLNVAIETRQAAEAHLRDATARVEDLECRPLVLITSRTAYAKALVDAQVCDAAEAERRALRTYPSPAEVARG
jgi:hypothetical protein